SWPSTRNWRSRPPRSAPGRASPPPCAAASWPPAAPRWWSTPRGPWAPATPSCCSRTGTRVRRARRWRGGRRRCSGRARTCAPRLPVGDLWGRTRLAGREGAPPDPACVSGSPYQPVAIAYDVDPVAALAVLERPEEFPGVQVTSQAVRTYPAPEGVNAAHLVG